MFNNVDLEDLHLLAKSLEVVYYKKGEYLINQGADWNKQTNYGDTPLMNACRKNKDNNNLEIIKILLLLGADVTVENVGGYTALSYAEKKKDEK